MAGGVRQAGARGHDMNVQEKGWEIGVQSSGRTHHENPGTTATNHQMAIGGPSSVGSWRLTVSEGGLTASQQAAVGSYPQVAVPTFHKDRALVYEGPGRSHVTCRRARAFKRALVSRGTGQRGDVESDPSRLLRPPSTHDAACPRG